MLELPRPPSEWTFVGRKAELDLALAELDAGRPGLVVGGPPGAGRTRLAREIAAAAAGRGVASVWLVSGEEADATTLAAFEAAPNSGAARPRLLVIDDAHLLDAASARRVERLARGRKAFIVATVASGLASPPAIVALWKEGTVPRIELRALAEPEIASLLESALAAPADRGTQRLLWRASQGNLVWLRELLCEGLRCGALCRSGGVWRWSGPLQLGLALRGLLLERVERLPQEAQRAFEVVASIGPVELELLGAALEDGSVERLEREGLIALERDGLRRSVHAAEPLRAQAAREEMPQSRAARIHRALGHALLGWGLRRPGDRLRAASSLLEGDPAAAAPFLMNAAEEAWAEGDAPLAERLARAASRGAQAVQARHVLAEALADQGRFEEAIAEWEALDAGALDDRARARAATSHAAILAFARGRPDAARELLDAAAARVASEDSLQSLAAMRASIDLGGSPTRILADSEQLLRSPDLAPYVEARALISLSVAANMSGRFHRALGEQGRALRAAQRCKISFPLAELWCEVNAFWAHLFSGALDLAEQLALDRCEVHADDPSVAARAYWTHALGIAAIWRGRAGPASALLREAAALLLAYDNGARRLVLYDLAVARAMAGVASDAEQALREAEASRPASPATLPGDVRARAFVRAAIGERSAARDASLAGGQKFLAEERVVPAVLALHDAVRFGAGRDAAHALVAAASRTDGPLLRALAAHGFALATRDGHALDAASRGLALLGVLFYAAEAARAACEEHARAGRNAAALAARQAFEQLASRCEGAWFPPLLAGDPLTRREHDVAELASAGASDREIATRLMLSVRTVHAHLRSVYNKLDVDGRSALRVLLAKEPRKLR